MLVNLEEASALLQRGEVVAIPTETVYGLAADATNEVALRQIYVVKERPADNPLIVHIGDISHVNNWAAEFSPLAQKLAKAFWPGPFTLVLPAKSHVSMVIRANEPTVALRVPNHPLTLQLLKQSGLSVAAPSANKYTQLSPTTAAHVAAGLGDAVPVLDGGACTVGIESTIVSVVGDDWVLLRHGMISEDAITALAGKSAIKTLQTLPKAPGQHLLHYSPRTPLILCADIAELNGFLQTHFLTNKTCAALVFGENPAFSENKAPQNCFTITLPAEPAAAAEQLYSALHTLDSLGVDTLLVALPPNTPAWAAVLDRLTRAGYSKE